MVVRRRGSFQVGQYARPVPGKNAWPENPLCR